VMNARKDRKTLSFFPRLPVAKTTTRSLPTSLPVRFKSICHASCTYSGPLKATRFAIDPSFITKN
jgi:hypothetical protein